ncbi:unnamed protein product [Durusdinium trenchii]|uniref:IRG-type G domain-containing protein n=1 Tax=Durusdinium trenchii TaxID=1381693 RepID=A0ABP0QB17_9DINO
MPSELLNALFKRRSDVDSSGQVWESKPEESSADAGALHLAGLTFDGPSAQEWLKQLEPSPEEDLLAEAINEGLAEREKTAPSHVPLAVKPEEARRLKELAAELGSLQELFSKERERLGAEKEEVRAKQAEIARREAELQAQQEEHKRREDARKNYPQPAWLDKVDGCINIAVVGNSGVGKSLLINRLRRLRTQAEGWAPVGVNETTREPTMYPYPNQPSVRLWDLPGAGTAAVPAESYLQDMGLRYFDSVVVVSAGRFTEMEVVLRAELERHAVPYYMVRTKVDQDIANNKEDNFTDKHDTLKQIRDDLEKTHKVETSSLYLVSSRDPDDYDLPRLLANLFPGLKRQMDPDAPAFCPAGTAASSQATFAPSAWTDAWAMPPALSLVLSGLQGGWCDAYGSTYLVQNDSCHVTLSTQHYTVVPLTQEGNAVWWLRRWYVNEEAVARARRSRELQWIPHQAQDLPLVWWFCH